MTHTEAHHDHPLGHGLLLFGLSASAVAWTIFVVWLMLVQLMELIRS